MSKHIKRSIDLVVASTAVVILAPVMAIIAAAILVKMGLPILFRQVRPGYHGRLFELVKFRTLREGAYHDGRPLPIKERITPLKQALEGKGTAPPDADDYTLRELKGMITTSPTHVSQPPHEPPVMRSRRRWSSGE